MKYVAQCLGFSLIIGLIAIWEQPHSQSAFRAYFLEFDANTLFGMTPELIETRYNISSLIYEDRERVVSLVKTSKSSGRFRENHTRLKIIHLGETLLVDQEGNVRINKREYRLSKAQFDTLKKELYLLMPKVKWPSN